MTKLNFLSYQLLIGLFASVLSYLFFSGNLSIVAYKGVVYKRVYTWCKSFYCHVFCYLVASEMILPQVDYNRFVWRHIIILITINFNNHQFNWNMTIISINLIEYNLIFIIKWLTQNQQLLCYEAYFINLKQFALRFATLSWDRKITRKIPVAPTP